jgi:cardiolipin synthase A/B
VIEPDPAPAPAPAPAPSRRRRRARGGNVVPAELRRFATNPAQWRPGNEITLLRAGEETFPAMLAAIAAARRTICFEVYIYESGIMGARFAEALIERARAGVVVRLVFDAIGSLALSGTLIEQMRAGGVQIHEYHPVVPWRRRWNVFRRDHRKILVVDDEVGFTGGLNVTDDNASVGQGGKGWHDLHCCVRGPIVLDLARLFRRTWLHTGGEPYPAPPRADMITAAPGTVPVHLLENAERRRRNVPRRAYLRAFRAARETIAIENAYFLPDRGVRRALVGAVRRGVDVSVIVPARSDVKAIEFASLYLLARLARRGIRIFRWKGAMMHAKAAVVDRVWSIVGSYNFDARSLFYNLEVAVEALDAGFGEVVALQLRNDEALSERFDERSWTALAWWRKALAWAAFQVRRWL